MFFTELDILSFLLYFGELFLLTLGVPVLCGLAVRVCARAFSALWGYRSGRILDVTSVIGTPIHELGHAVMCPLFGHKIQRMRLWSPRAENGVYGFVEHSYNRKNPWARLGNLFIGIGPIFSGLGVTVLMLWLCFPDAWSSYLCATAALPAQEHLWHDLLAQMLSLIGSLPQGFAQAPWRAVLGLAVILPISLHISLSSADVKGSLGALPLWTLMLLVFALPTYLCNVSAAIRQALCVWNVRLLSLFCVVIAFALTWVLLAAAVRLLRAFFRLF